MAYQLPNNKCVHNYEKIKIMNKQIHLKITFWLIIFLSISTITTAFHGNDDERKKSEKTTTKKTGAFGEPVERTGTINNAVKGQYRTAKKIDANFSGYVIQIKSSMDKLDVNDKIFAEFGQILVEENSNPRYIYFVGQFKSKSHAITYLNNIIGERYKDTKIIQFIDGKRT